MNGDIYRLREELIERITGLEQAIGLLEANADYGKVLAERMVDMETEHKEEWRAYRELTKTIVDDRVAEGLKNHKCQCGNKATKELRTSFSD